MIDISKLSERYSVRRMTEADADAILGLCLANAQYYRYCGRRPSKELILNDLGVTPPGVDKNRKYYLGFYGDGTLTAVMDLIDGYPDRERCFIGFFMMNAGLQGRGLGSELIGEVCGYLKENGYAAVMLGIDKGNPQSTHFWKKNGFIVMSEVERGGGTILVSEKTL